MLILFWVAGIGLAPLLSAHDAWGGAVLYFLYKPVCHQIPERSFSLHGFPLAVCIRCNFFYLAGLFIFATYIFRTKTNWWPTGVYILLSLPVVADFVAEKSGLYSNCATVRLITGALLGIAVFHFLIMAISNSRMLRQET